MTKPTHIAIAGTNGRMGRELIFGCLSDKNVVLNEALVRAGSLYIGEAAANLTELKVDSVKCTSQDEPLNENTNVLIDFTLPDNLISNMQRCVSRKISMVIGATGFSKEQQKMIEEASKQIPIVQASNMSQGVNLTLVLLRQLTQMLGDNTTINITETHHIHKKDSPSGTAVTMAEVIANALNKDLDDCLLPSDPVEHLILQPGFIHINSIREGSEMGVHNISFLMDGEQIDITHKSTSRQIYAKGAIKAAAWLQGKKPGLYSMADVLKVSEST